jgi:hypothetical protein
MGDESAIALAEAQQRHLAAMAAMEQTWWSMLLDPMLWLPFVIVAIAFWLTTRSGPFKRQYEFFNHQRNHLDHQRAVNEKALQQTEAFERLIAEQYRETNSRADRALALSERAIELHTAALAELASLNATLARMAAGRPPAAAAPSPGGAPPPP